MKKINLILTLILVLAAAAALSAQTVLVTPTSLTFTGAANGAVQTQTISVTNSVNGPMFDAFVQNGTVGTATWLTIVAPGGAPQTSVANVNTPANLTVRADPTNLPAGNYTGFVNVFGVSSTGFFGPTIQVTVTFNVGNLGVSPSTVSFAYQSGSGAVPPATTVTLTASTATTYTTSLSGTDCAWLQQPANGSVTGTASMTVAPVSAAVTGLSVGAHTCSIVITPTTGPAVTVPVTMTVTAAPTVTFSPSSISIVYQTTSTSVSTNTPAQNLTITNPGTQALSYFVSPGVPWLTATPDPAHPTTIPAGGSVNVTIAYVISSNLSPNTYSASIGVLVPGASNNAFNVPVSLLISSSPLVSMSTAPVSFTYQVGTSVPGARTITATTTAVESSAPANQQIPLFVTATTTNGGNWLSCQGLATCSQQQVQGTSFTISLNPTIVQTLGAGTYTGTISVFGFNTANATAASPLTIAVTLKVSNDPLITATFGGCTMGLVTGLTCPINFPYEVGQNNPVTQVVTVGSSSNVPLTVTPTATQNVVAGCPANWLSVSAVTSPSGTTEAFTVSANPAGIPNGTVCTGSISVAAVNPASGNASPNSPLTIPVNLYVNNTAMLVVNPISLSFTVLPNQLSTVQNLIVTSTGTSAADQLNFTASRPAADSWLLVDTTPNKSTAAGSVSVAANSGTLAPGTYTSTITLTAAGSGVLDSPLTVPVVMTITGASVTADKTTLTFNQTLGGPVPASQNVTLTAANGNVSYVTSVSYQSGQATGWLNATANGTVNSGSTGTVQVSVNGSSLAAGTYNGAVTIASPGVTGSPITVNVTLVVAPGTLAATPATLSFTEVAGSAAQSQNVSVTGTPGALNFTVNAATTTGGNWLVATSNASTTPATVSVTASNTGLAPGTYNGTVTIASAGATGSPQTVNVTLTVVAAQTITVTPATLNFTYIIGTQTTLQAQQVQVASSGTGATFTAAATTTSGGSWLVVSPTTGTAPATLQVSIQPNGLTAGNYTGTIAITSPASTSSPAASVTVNLTVQAVPPPTFTAVANAASYVNGPVSPGENIVIFGTGLGPATLTLGHITNGVYDSTVANTQVTFDGTPAPIIYTSAGQTSVMVPYGVAGRSSTSIKVIYQGVPSAGITYNVVGSAPGIYTANSSGSGQGAILNQDFSVNSAGNPAAKNSVVAVYMTGEGTTQPASTDGTVAPVNGTGLNKPILGVTATVGGIPATVTYYGSAPGIIYGVMQVNVQVPPGAPSGPNVPIVITVGTNATQSGAAPVTVALQ